MTKFKVFSENKEEEKETYLRLIPICGGVIRLIACDKNGGFLPAGSILEITEEGTIRLRRNISSDIGLKLSPEGMVIVTTEE